MNMHGDLILQCKAGDRNAYFKIYKLYSKAMYNACYRITGSEEDAEDALQEGFISAFKNLKSYRGDAAFGAWLKRIVINKAIDIVKRGRHEHLPDQENWDVAEPETDNGYMTELSVQKVKEAIMTLPDGYRTVLSLYLLEGYDHQEIGEILGVSESTSKSQLNRAKNKLKEILTVRL